MQPEYGNGDADAASQSIVSLIFFTTYIVFQPPSTVIVRKIGPRIHLAAITLLWGSLMIGMGFSRNFGDLAAMRVVLGVLEAGFFPSCVYLLSTWYTRCEESQSTKQLRTLTFE
jgi:MFS family permease